MAATRLYSIKEVDPFPTVGTWAFVNSSNQTSFDHTDADETAVVVIPIPKMPRTFNQDDPAISVISVTFSIATAALDAAPTAVLSKYSKHATTKVWSDSAVTQVLTFAGTDTAGTAASGTWDAIVTITTPTRLADNESLELELTFNCAATTVLKLWGVGVTHTGA